MILNTSEIEKVLTGETDAKDFILKYQDAMNRLLSRNDSAAISSDLGLVFDSTGFKVTNTQIMKLQKSLNHNEIYFLTNLVILNDFEYDHEETENIIIQLSNSL